MKKTFLPFDLLLDDIFNNFSTIKTDITNIFEKGDIGSVNIKKDVDKYIIDVLIAGLSKTDIDIDIDKDNITISSNKKEELKEYNRKEFGKTEFKRRFKLPDDSDVENISANSKDGILTIIINRIKVKPDSKKVKID